MKRQTKAQKEAAQKSALRRRVADLAIGARLDDVEQGDYWCFTADSLCRLLRAVDIVFAKEELNHLTKHWNVDEYDSLDKLTDFLYEQGVRA